MTMGILEYLLHRPSHALRDYELAILVSWRSKINQKAQQIFDWQLKTLPHVNRQTLDKVLFLHAKSSGWYARNWSTEQLFSIRREVVAARVILSGAQKARLKGDIVLLAGRIVSIEFNRPPRSVFPDPLQFRLSEVDWKKVDPTVPVEGVQVFIDPSTNLMNDFESLDATLPTDYDAALSTHGSDWLVLPVNRIQRIVRPDDNFFVIATNARGFDVGLRQGDEDSALYVIPHDADEAHKIDVRFSELVRPDSS
jgi:hypothetical protein